MQKVLFYIFKTPAEDCKASQIFSVISKVAHLEIAE